MAVTTPEAKQTAINQIKKLASSLEALTYHQDDDTKLLELFNSIYGIESGEKQFKHYIELERNSMLYISNSTKENNAKLVEWCSIPSEENEAAIENIQTFAAKANTQDFEEASFAAPAQNFIKKYAELKGTINWLDLFQDAPVYVQEAIVSKL